jgi:DNA repair protein RadC
MTGQTLLPQEKMLQFGERALSDTELLAVILRTGSVNVDVLTLCEKLLCRYQNLASLSKCTVEELVKDNDGIGTIKALQIKAAIELGRRSIQKPLLKEKISSAEQAAEYVFDSMGGLDKEVVCTLLLDSKSQVLSYETISIGTLNASLIHAREVFKSAIKFSAASIILFHNHPSGDVKPSLEDIRQTQKLSETAKIVGIPLKDHIIIGENAYYSMKENNWL